MQYVARRHSCRGVLRILNLAPPVNGGTGTYRQGSDRGVRCVQPARLPDRYLPDVRSPVERSSHPESAARVSAMSVAWTRTPQSMLVRTVLTGQDGPAAVGRLIDPYSDGAILQARSSVLQTYCAIAHPAVCPPPATAPRWPSDGGARQRAVAAETGHRT